METMKDIVEETGIGSIHVVIDQGGTKYVCFTALDVSNLGIGVTDGVDLWRLTLDKEDLDNQRDLASIASREAFLSRLKQSMVSGDLQVSTAGVRMTLCAGQGSKSIKLDLYEAKAAEKKTEMSRLLFRLAESASELEVKLDKANQTIGDLKQQKNAAGGAIGGFMDISSPKKKNQPQAAPKRVGMSVINPGSKKRKAATGVQFD